tara:strand:- start:2168 stop:2563 length:396 start_codon:yes stop_codon:yes gene_type:complete
MNISVKNGSSIHQLATLWGEENLPTNFCSLFWLVLFRFGLISVGCICIGAFLGFLVAGIVASIVVGYVIWTAPLIVLTILFALVGAIFACAFIAHKASESMDENPKNTLSNMVNAYSSWKDKYCPKVTEQD